MKSRQEYRAVFSSPSMFYRALHIISTQRYRQPVRRYIVDLFTLELDSVVVAALSECAKTMRAHPSYEPTTSDVNRLSMFGRMGRSRRNSESDDDDEMDTGVVQKAPVAEQPAISLRPMSRIIGFAI